jgi:hypothetical protein
MAVKNDFSWEGIEFTFDRQRHSLCLEIPECLEGRDRYEYESGIVGYLDRLIRHDDTDYAVFNDAGLDWMRDNMSGRWTLPAYSLSGFDDDAVYRTFHLMTFENVDDKLLFEMKWL